RLLLTFVLAVVWSCGGSSTPTTPTAAVSPPPSTPSPPRIRLVTINGNVTFTMIGETSQLTVTATFSDNTTKDVTSEGRWTVGDTRIASVSPGGLVTVMGYGSTFISFSYPMAGTSRTITATPAGTF